MIVRTVRIHERKVPLRRPYALSFVTLDTYVARIVEVITDTGARGMGEAVALPGYGTESDADVERALATIMVELTGRPLDDAFEHALTRMADTPFARSAVLTALDFARGVIDVPARLHWPLLAAVTAGAAADTVARCRVHIDAGYRTIKVKVGRDIDTDAAAARALLDEMPDDVRLRFDANQAYDMARTMRILEALDHPRCALVELLEQPMPKECWDDFAAVAPDAPVPLMLDESIETPADVDRAAEVGAALVKLKLCKHAGPSDALAMARHAWACGLKCVLGNGVATDVGNLGEAIVRAADPTLFMGAGEGNGFAKLRYCVLRGPPRVEAGALVWERGDDRDVGDDRDECDDVWELEPAR